MYPHTRVLTVKFSHCRSLVSIANHMSCWCFTGRLLNTRNLLNQKIMMVATFNIATFNCAGMADATRRTALLNLFRKLRVQIICVQETHSRPEKEAQWAREWAPGVVILNSATNMANAQNGVAIFINDFNLQVSAVKRDLNGRLISMDVSTRLSTIHLINIYAPCNLLPQNYKIKRELTEIQLSNTKQKPFKSKSIKTGNQALGSKEFFQQFAANRKNTTIEILSDQQGKIITKKAELLEATKVLSRAVQWTPNRSIGDAPLFAAHRAPACG